jgi:hypothetical protein
MSGPSSSVGVGPTPNLREGDASTVVAQETWEAISREAISESLAKAAEANEAPAADIEATEPNKETNPAAPPPPPRDGDRRKNPLREWWAICAIGSAVLIFLYLTVQWHACDSPVSNMSFVWITLIPIFFLTILWMSPSQAKEKFNGFAEWLFSDKAFRWSFLDKLRWSPVTQEHLPKVVEQVISIGGNALCIRRIITTTIAVSVYFSDFNSMVKNWDTAPVTSIYATTGKCSKGDEKIVLPKFRTRSGACACSIPTLSSSEASCSAYQKRNGCLSQSTVDKFKLKWRGHSLCAVRGGQEQANRPIPPSGSGGDDCAAGYKRCGSTGDYEATRSICFPSAEECPLTSVEGSTSASVPDGFSSDDSTSLSDDYALYFLRGDDSSSPSAFPFVEVEFAFYDVSGDSGLCYPNDLSRRTDQDDFRDGASNSFSYRTFHGKPCQDMDEVYRLEEDQVLGKKAKAGVVDARYELLDSLSVDSFLLDNFEDHEWCTSCSKCDDYLETGNECATGSDVGSESDCLMYERVKDAQETEPMTENNRQDLEWAGCVAGIEETGTIDEVCEQAMYQTKCGALKRFAEKSDGNFRAGIFGRREILWEPTCKQTITDMSEIAELPSLLLLWCIFMVLFYAIFGVFAPSLFLAKILLVDIQLCCKIERSEIDKRYASEAEATGDAAVVSTGASTPGFVSSFLVNETGAQQQQQQPQQPTAAPVAAARVTAERQNVRATRQESMEFLLASLFVGTRPTTSARVHIEEIPQDQEAPQQQAAAPDHDKVVRAVSYSRQWSRPDDGPEYLPFFFTKGYQRLEQIYYRKFMVWMHNIITFLLCFRTWIYVNSSVCMFDDSVDCSEGNSKKTIASMVVVLYGVKDSLEYNLTWAVIFIGMSILTFKKKLILEYLNFLGIVKYSKIQVRSPTGVERTCTVIEGPIDRSNNAEGTSDVLSHSASSSGMIKIHYDGFDDAHDEWIAVESDRIVGPDDDTVEVAQITQQADEPSGASPPNGTTTGDDGVATGSLEEKTPG